MAGENSKAIYWIMGVIGIVAVAALLMSFTGKGKNDTPTVITGNGQTSGVICNPIDPGFDINGVQNSLCGTPKCDPTRPGFNLSGFPDTDCGFGRKGR